MGKYELCPECNDILELDFDFGEIAVVVCWRCGWGSQIAIFPLSEKLREDLLQWADIKKQAMPRRDNDEHRL